MKIITAQHSTAKAKSGLGFPIPRLCIVAVLLLVWSLGAEAQTAINEVRVNSSSDVYLTAEVHTNICGSQCFPESHTFYGGLYDVESHGQYILNYAEDGCGNQLEADEVVAVTFTEYLEGQGGGALASWTMSFCDKDNLYSYTITQSKTESYWSPGFGMAFTVTVSYNPGNAQLEFEVQ